MRRFVAALLLVASTARFAAQVFNWVKLDHLNDKLCGKVIDYTQNHGSDRRICSAILGRRHNLYVYLPPNYDPSAAYPLIVFLHRAHIDEHAFLEPGVSKGNRPDDEPGGNSTGCDHGAGRDVRRREPQFYHSLWVNGLGGEFEAHVIAEIVPFLMTNYSIQPEHEDTR